MSLVKKSLSLALSYVFALTIVLDTGLITPQARAEEKPPQVNVPDGITPVYSSEFEKKVNDVVYSLANLDEVTADLQRVNEMAAKAISTSVTEEILVRWTTALELLSAVLYDFSLPIEQKRKYVSALTGEIGSLMFRVMRHREDAFVNVDEAIDRVMNDSSLSTEEKNKRRIEIEDEAFARYFPGNEATVGQRISLTVKEVFFDVKNLLTVSRSAKNELLWSSWERVKRERLGQDVLKRFETFSADVLAPLGQKSERSRATWDEDVLGKMEKIRETRLGAQKLSRGMMVGLAVATFLMPGVDIVGIANGRSEYSMFASGVIYSGIWVTAAVLKSFTISSKVLKEIAKIRDILQNPEHAIQAAYEKAKGAVKAVMSLNPFRRRKGAVCEEAFGL